MFPLFCFKTWIKVTIILLPLEPRGCPKATAPPFTSTLLGSISKSLVLTKPTTEKASFNSQKSTSLTDKFAFTNALFIAFVGVVVNHLGSC